MVFAQSIKEQAFTKSGARCECERTGHPHAGRCDSLLMPTLNTEYRLKPNGSTESAADCEVLCSDCNRLTNIAEREAARS